MDHADRLKRAPRGTKAPAIGGGWWFKTERGWKWNGPDGSGSTFPQPGGDWNLKLLYPRCEICGCFLDKDGRCAKVDSGYFEPAEHW